MNDTTESHSKNLTLSINNDFFGLSFLQKDIEDDKEYTRFVKGVEAQIRRSNEYKEFISYLKSELDINFCFVMNKMHSTEVKIEMHHTPFTLYDIVDCVIKKLISLEKPFNSFLVAYLVMQLHYANKAGLIPLSSTMHQYVHSESANNVQIPRDAIIGNIEEFFKEYKDYISPDLKLLYQRCLATKYDKDTDKTVDSQYQSKNMKEEYMKRVRSIKVRSTPITCKESKKIEEVEND